MASILNCFRLFSDETRLRIMVLLKQSDLCVCQICGILDLPQPKVSKHLTRLRNVGLVVDTRKEKFIFYSLAVDDVVINDLLTNLVKHMDRYPQLMQDHADLANRDVYIAQCKTNQRS